MTLTRVGKEGCSRLLSRWEIMRKSMIHTHTYVSDPNNICRALLAFFMIVSYCNLTVGHVSPDYPVPAPTSFDVVPLVWISQLTRSLTENSASLVLNALGSAPATFPTLELCWAVIFCLFCANFLSLSTLFENRKDATLSLSFCQFWTNRIDTKTVNVGKTALICVRVEGDLEWSAERIEHLVHGKEVYRMVATSSWQGPSFPSPLHGFCHQ